MKLDILALSKSFAHMVVPFIGQTFELRILVLKFSKGELLHYLYVERASYSILPVDPQELFQWSELK
ncbi:MAG: hypothetical protein LC775_19985, partial [Acidobacteria bacterium]|nr:hypothetical protein [Acidobacteriota bacterium]